MRDRGGAMKKRDYNSFVPLYVVVYLVVSSSAMVEDGANNGRSFMKARFYF